MIWHLGTNSRALGPRRAQLLAWRRSVPGRVISAVGRHRCTLASQFDAGSITSQNAI